jgi:hypothetical protein
MGLLSVTTSAYAQTANTQTDGRDYEVLAYLPKDTLAAIAYYRAVSSSDKTSLSQSVGVLRASYVLKFGNLAVVPFDATLPIVDVSVFVPGMMGPTATVIHTSGLGDATYLPTIGYIIPEDETTHTVIAATANITAPTGSYSSASPVNIGDNRWRIQPNIDVSQRFLKKLTVDLVGDLAFYTANNSQFFATMMGAGDVKLTQNQTFGLEAHVTADLSADMYVGLSYYMNAIGERDIQQPPAIPTAVQYIPSQTVQSVRFTYGIRVEKGTLLLLQYNQDIEESGQATISRFFGARLSHVAFF